MSAQPSPAPVLLPGYTCTFCRRTFTQKDSIIIGEPKEARIAKLAGMLAGHLAKEHRQEFATLGIAAQQIGGWLFTSRFEHNDPELEAFTEATRLQIRRITERVVITDEIIEERVKTFLSDLTPEQSVGVIHMLKTMRDTITEAPA